MSHATVVVGVSALYIGLVTLLRLMVDVTSDARRHVYKMNDYAQELYDQFQTATSAHERLRFASMSLAIYSMLLESEYLPRPTIDRIAQCDVQRRRRRLQRFVEVCNVSVPTQRGESVSAMNVDSQTEARCPTSVLA
jgi:hypothetical protein